FFHHFASLLEYFIIVSNTPPFQFFGSLVKSVITKANVCQILQWRPTIRKVPLLPTLMKRGNHPTWLPKAFDNMFMIPCRLLLRSNVEEKRIYTCERHYLGRLVRHGVVVHKNLGIIVPKVFVYRFFALFCFAEKIGRRFSKGAMRISIGKG